MSEKESKFIAWLSGILGTFLVLLIAGLFTFVCATGQTNVIQDERIKANEVKNKENEVKVETMRVEIREDLKEIKMNIDKLAVSVIENNNN